MSSFAERLKREETEKKPAVSASFIARLNKPNLQQPQVQTPPALEGRQYMPETTFEEFKARQHEIKDMTASEAVSETLSATAQALPMVLTEMLPQAVGSAKNTLTGQANSKDAILAAQQSTDETNHYLAGVDYYGNTKAKVWRMPAIWAHQYAPNTMLSRAMGADPMSEDEMFKNWQQEVGFIRRSNQRLKEAVNPEDYEGFQWFLDPTNALAPFTGGLLGGATKLVTKPAKFAKRVITGKTVPEFSNLTKPQAALSARVAGKVLDPLGGATSKVGEAVEFVASAPERLVAKMTNDPLLNKSLSKNRPWLARTITGAGVGGVVGEAGGIVTGAALAGGGAIIKDAGSSLKIAARLLREGDTLEGGFFKRLSKEMAAQGDDLTASVWGLADRMGIGRAVEGAVRVGGSTAESAIVFGPFNYLMAGGDPEEAGMLTATAMGGALAGAGIREPVRNYLPAVWKMQYFNQNAKFLSKYKDQPVFNVLAEFAQKDPNSFTSFVLHSETNDGFNAIPTSDYADTRAMYQDPAMRATAEAQINLDRANTGDAPLAGKELSDAVDQFAHIEGMNKGAPYYNQQTQSFRVDFTRPNFDLRKILAHEYVHHLQTTGILTPEQFLGNYTEEFDGAGARRYKGMNEGQLTRINDNGFLEASDYGKAFWKDYVETLSGDTKKEMADLATDSAKPEFLDALGSEFEAHVAETHLGGVSRGGRLIRERASRGLLLDKIMVNMISPLTGGYIDRLMARAGIPIFLDPSSHGGGFDYKDIYGNKQRDTGWRYFDVTKDGRKLMRSIKDMPLPTEYKKLFTKRIKEHMAAPTIDDDASAKDQDIKLSELAKNPALQRELLGNDDRVKMNAKGNVQGFNSVREANKLANQRAKMIADLIDGANPEDTKMFPRGGVRKQTSESGATTYEGEYMQGWLLDSLKAAALLDDYQYASLKAISDTMQTSYGTAFSTFYRKAIKTRGKKQSYATVRGRHRPIMPYSIAISRGTKGDGGSGFNIYFRTLDLEVLDKNIKQALKQVNSKKRRLPSGFMADSEFIMSMVQDYLTNHSRGYKGNGSDSGRVTNGSPARKFSDQEVNFLNELMGVRTKANEAVNDLFGELSDDGVAGSKNMIRSLRFERMGKIQKLQMGGLLPFKYGDVKMNFSGEVDALYPPLEGRRAKTADYVGIEEQYRTSYPYYRQRGKLRVDDSDRRYSGEAGVQSVRTNADDYLQASKFKYRDMPMTQPVPRAELMELADAYEKAPHTPNDPKVIKAYTAMKEETLAQWNFFGERGVNFQPWLSDGQPYQNSMELFQDIQQNNRVWFFPTFPGGESEGGFGTFTAAQNVQHPLLELVPDLKVDGVALVYNDVFRAVHDYVGHGARGYQFGPKGEFNAYLEHSRLYSDTAQDALRSETAAQNAWVNFGAHLRLPDGQMPSKQDPHFVAPADRPFADQKAVILDDTLKNFRHSGEVDSPQWYSELQRQIKNSPMSEKKPISADQWSGYLRGKVKEEELKWTQFPEWIKLKGRATQAEVLEYLRGEGAVHIDETWLGDKPNKSKTKFLEARGYKFKGIEETGQWAVQQPNSTALVRTELGDDVVYASTAEAAASLIVDRSSEMSSIYDSLTVVDEVTSAEIEQMIADEGFAIKEHYVGWTDAPQLSIVNSVGDTIYLENFGADAMTSASDRGALLNMFYQDRHGHRIKAVVPEYGDFTVGKFGEEADSNYRVMTLMVRPELYEPTGVTESGDVKRGVTPPMPEENVAKAEEYEVQYAPVRLDDRNYVDMPDKVQEVLFDEFPYLKRSEQVQDMVEDYIKKNRRIARLKALPVATRGDETLRAETTATREGRISLLQKHSDELEDAITGKLKTLGSGPYADVKPVFETFKEHIEHVATFKQPRIIKKATRVLVTSEFADYQTFPEGHAEELVANFIKTENEHRRGKWNRRHQGKGGEYVDSFPSHYDPSFVHMRVTDRIDPRTGKTVLHIEEFQSDAHQQARKRGYINGTFKKHTKDTAEKAGYSIKVKTNGRVILSKVEVFRKTNEGEKVPSLLSDPAKQTIAAYDTVEEALAVVDEREFEASKGGVPDAPFRSTPDMNLRLFKHALMKAIKEGRETVSWSRGVEQAVINASSLRGKVSHVDFEGVEFQDVAINGEGMAIAAIPNSINTERVVQDLKNDGKNVAEVQPMNLHRVRIVMKEGRQTMNFKVRDDGVIIEGDSPRTEDKLVGTHIDRLIGKTVLSAMKDSPEGGKVEGKDLAIGVEGYRDIYDRMTVGAVNKWLKKFTGKKKSLEEGKFVGKKNTGGKLGQPYFLRLTPQRTYAVFSADTNEPVDKLVIDAGHYVDDVHTSWALPITPELVKAVTDMGVARFSGEVEHVGAVNKRGKVRVKTIPAGKLRNMKAPHSQLGFSEEEDLFTLNSRSGKVIWQEYDLVGGESRDAVRKHFEKTRPITTHEDAQFYGQQTKHADSAVTEEDNAYLKLAEAGDKKSLRRARRMVAETARQSGYATQGFHRTWSDFTEFKHSKERHTWETKGVTRTMNGSSGRAFFFGASAEKTPAFHQAKGGRGKVMDVHLKIKSPLVVDADTKGWAIDALSEGNTEFPHLVTEEARANILGEGYDGIHYY
jgi:hypothetical protein